MRGVDVYGRGRNAAQGVFLGAPLCGSSRPMCCSEGLGFRLMGQISHESASDTSRAFNHALLRQGASELTNANTRKLLTCFRSNEPRMHTNFALKNKSRSPSASWSQFQHSSNYEEISIDMQAERLPAFKHLAVSPKQSLEPQLPSDITVCNK